VPALLLGLALRAATTLVALAPIERAAGDTLAPRDTLAASAGPGPAAADTSLRVPGAWLRFGASQEQVLARGPFVVVPTLGQRNLVTRRGDCRWFGVEVEASLSFREGRLARVRFAAKDLAPHALDYVEDQLTRLGYRRQCERRDLAVRNCEWSGATHVRLQMQPRSLSADIEPPRLAPVAARPRAVAAPRETVAVLPEILSLAPGAAFGPLPAPHLLSAPEIRPRYPQAALDAGVQGRVRVRALVDTSGLVIATELIRSIPELDSAAVGIVREYQFVPYLSGGRRIRFRVDCPVTFTLY